MARAVGRDRSWLYAHGDHLLGSESRGLLERLVVRRMRLEPMAYILGSREFMGLDLKVESSVLVPRPETEILVEAALNWAHRQDRELWAADVGSGSGCIAVSLAFHLRQLKVVAIDVSAAALAMVRINVARHRLSERVLPVRGDLLSPLAGAVNLVCANLPYLSAAQIDGLGGEVAAHEPHSALFGGPTGLELNSRLLRQARVHLRAPWAIYLEMDPSQGQALAEIARRHYPDATIAVLDDLASRPRCLEIRHDQC